MSDFKMFQVIENFVSMNLMIYLRYAQLPLKEHVIYELNSTLWLKNVKHYFVHTGLNNLQKTKRSQKCYSTLHTHNVLVIFALNSK
jgi:hypothetical protein